MLAKLSCRALKILTCSNRDSSISIDALSLTVAGYDRVRLRLVISKVRLRFALMSADGPPTQGRAVADGCNEPADSPAQR